HPRNAARKQRQQPDQRHSGGLEEPGLSPDKPRREQGSRGGQFHDRQRAKSRHAELCQILVKLGIALTLRQQMSECSLNIHRVYIGAFVATARPDDEPAAVAETKTVRYKTGRALARLVDVLLSAVRPLLLLHPETRLARDVPYEVRRRQSARAIH